MLKVALAVVIAVAGVAAFATGLVLLVVAADPRAVDAELARSARLTLTAGSVATVVGSALLARSTILRR